MRKLFLLTLFLFMGCATIPEKCVELRIVANQTYYKKIDVNLAQEGNSKPYYVMTEKTMKEINKRYDALADYVNCFEGK